VGRNLGETRRRSNISASPKALRWRRCGRLLVECEVTKSGLEHRATEEQQRSVEDTRVSVGSDCHLNTAGHVDADRRPDPIDLGSGRHCRQDRFGERWFAGENLTCVAQRFSET